MTAAAARPQVVLAGNPNVGKTTLFNALTGSSAKVSNYPGITVERRTRRARAAGRPRADLHDVPGTYSLNARSAEEQIAFDALAGLAGAAAPDAVVVCVDATQVARSAVPAAAGPGARRALRRRADDGRRGRRRRRPIRARSASCSAARSSRSPRARSYGLAELVAAVDRALRARAHARSGAGSRRPTLRDAPRRGARGAARRVAQRARYGEPDAPPMTRSRCGR